MVLSLIGGLLVVVMVMMTRCLNKICSKDKCRGLMKVCFPVYLLLVLLATILSRQPNDENLILFVPLSMVMRMLGAPVESVGDFRALLQGTLEISKPDYQKIFPILENFILFIPFGFLMKAMGKESKTVRIVLLGFAFSLGIELCQLIFRLGWFEVDDILFNTLGSWAGALLYRVSIPEHE